MHGHIYLIHFIEAGINHVTIFQDLFHLHEIILIPAGINNYKLDKSLNEIIYPFPNLKGPQSSTTAPFKFGIEDLISFQIHNWYNYLFMRG